MRIDINTRKIVEETAGKQIVAEIAKVINAHWKSYPNLSRDNDQMCNHSFDCDQNCEYMKSFIKLLEKIKVNQGKDKSIKKVLEDIARESIIDLIKNASEKKYKFRIDYMEEELTVDELIRGRIKKIVDDNIETMISSRAKSFVDELRKRYDMAFATFIVDNMRKQNMLKEDKIAELLKDNPNEK